MKWISVKERLPEKDKDVLVSNEHGEMFVGDYIPKFKEWYIPATGYYPTHWAELPAPPMVTHEQQIGSASYIKTDKD